jgi:glycosyltransferase involved in cell wall biosynthesis
VKIAVDALNLLADERGMGRYVRTVVRELAAHTGDTLTLLVRDPRNAAAYRKIVGEQALIASWKTAARRHRYDAVWYPWNAMRFRSHAPSLVTINDDFAFRFPARGFIARRREQRPILTAVKSATKLATISGWSRDALAERFHLDPQAIAVLPLAPGPFFTPGIEASPFVEPFVLAVGSREARKNIDFLAEAMMRAFPEGGVRLVVVGPLETRTRARMRIPFSEIAGISDERLRTLYRSAHAVAVPSQAEGFGLVVAEAQACGAPVIAANSSALPEAAGNAAVLLDLDYPDAWSDALRQIVTDTALAARLRALAIARWSFVNRNPTTAAVRTLLAMVMIDAHSSR